MLRKTKKVISIACVLIFILPIMSYSMDKEEFLKFLIESSYPESSTKDDNSKEKEDFYVLQHIIRKQFVSLQCY